MCNERGILTETDVVKKKSFVCKHRQIYPSLRTKKLKVFYRNPTELLQLNITEFRLITINR